MARGILSNRGRVGVSGTSRPVACCRSPLVIIAALGVASLFGCSAVGAGDDDPKNGTGDGDSNENGDGDFWGDGDSAVNDQGEACDVEPGAGIIRRLTPREYDAALVDVFGGGVPVESPLPGSVEEEGFSTLHSGLVVVDLTAQAIFSHAEKVGEWVIGGNQGVVASCQTHDAACWDTVVREFGRHIFRQPLTESMVERQVALFSEGENFDDGLCRIISAMIQSPFFLYRRELGSGAELAQFSDHELASALSFSVIGAPPDAELSAAADAGTLRSSEVFQSHAERLLGTPAAALHFSRFVDEWLALHLVLTNEKTEGGVEVSDSLRQALHDEAINIAGAVFQRGQGFQELLTTKETYLNAESAAHYGFSVNGEAIQMFNLAGTNRDGGILGTGAFLLGHSASDSSSPTRRGLVIAHQFLDLEIPEPPADVDTSFSSVTDYDTTREKFEEHTESSACRSCHQNIDPFGFAFEHYDGLGRYRELENGVPINAESEFAGLSDSTFNGLSELSALLAGNGDVHGAFAGAFVEYVLGQHSWDEGCTSNHVASAAQARTGSFKDYITSILALGHFASRPAQKVSS